MNYLECRGFTVLVAGTVGWSQALIGHRQPAACSVRGGQRHVVPLTRTC